MRVAIVIDQIGGGGGEVFIKNISERLQAEGDIVEVFSGEKEDLVTKRVPFSGRGSFFRLFGAWRSSRVLEDKMGEFEPDLILILSPVAAISTMMTLSENSSYKSVYSPLYLALDHWKMIGREPTWRIKKLVEKMALRFPYDKIFALSENMMKRMREAGANSSIEVVPIGVDTEEFHPSEKEEKNPVFLFVGRFEPEKGYNLFLDVSREVQNARFVMVGDEPEKLDQLPSNIEVRGKVSHSQMVDIYNEATALVLTSYTEGLPTVCLESLACETPVIASQVGGVPDLVINGETGFLVEPGDLEQLLEKIKFFLKNPGRATEMGKNGREHIVKNYDEKKTMQETVQRLQNIAKDP